MGEIGVVSFSTERAEIGGQTEKLLTSRFYSVV